MNNQEPGSYSSPLLRTPGDFIAPSETSIGPFANDPVLKRLSARTDRTDKRPAERLQTALIRGAPLAHDLVLELQIHAEGLPKTVTKEQIAYLYNFPSFASQKTWKEV
jgi:hypothetical protein